MEENLRPPKFSEICLVQPNKKTQKKTQIKWNEFHPYLYPENLYVGVLDLNKMLIEMRQKDIFYYRFVHETAMNKDHTGKVTLPCKNSGDLIEGIEFPSTPPPIFNIVISDFVYKFRTNDWRSKTRFNRVYFPGGFLPIRHIPYAQIWWEFPDLQEPLTVRCLAGLLNLPDDWNNTIDKLCTVFKFRNKKYRWILRDGNFMLYDDKGEIVFDFL